MAHGTFAVIKQDLYFIKLVYIYKRTKPKAFDVIMHYINKREKIVIEQINGAYIVILNRKIRLLWFIERSDMTIASPAPENYKH